MAVPVTVTTVAVGTPREVPGPRTGEATRTASWKDPVRGPVEVHAEGLAGDEQADPEHHGGREKAVYAYGTADLAWWEQVFADELGRPLDPLVFGQNLTVDGHPVSDAVIGERWRVGTVELEVSQPRIPCFKLQLRAGERSLTRRFAAANRPGAYFRVLTPGALAAGDAVTVLHRPDHGLTVAEAADIHHHHRDRSARLLAAPELQAPWHEQARERLARAGTPRP